MKGACFIQQLTLTKLVIIASLFVHSKCTDDRKEPFTKSLSGKCDKMLMTPKNRESNQIKENAARTNSDGRQIKSYESSKQQTISASWRCPDDNKSFHVKTIGTPKQFRAPNTPGKPANESSSVGIVAKEQKHSLDDWRPIVALKGAIGMFMFFALTNYPCWGSKKYGKTLEFLDIFLLRTAYIVC